MGLERRRELDGDELGIDLDLKACPICRRELLPWQDVCPEDGGVGVPKGQLPAVSDPLLARLLAEEDPSVEAHEGGDDPA